jgi:hypothetical protein
MGRKPNEDFVNFGAADNLEPPPANGEEDAPSFGDDGRLMKDLLDATLLLCL